MDQESGTSRLRDRDPPISTSCAFIYALVLIFSLLRSISNEARVARDRSYRRSPRVCTLLIYLFLRGRAIRKWQVVVLTRGNRNSFKEIVEKYFRLVSPVCLHFFFFGQRASYINTDDATLKSSVLIIHLARVFP